MDVYDPAKYTVELPAPCCDGNPPRFDGIRMACPDQSNAVVNVGHYGLTKRYNLSRWWEDFHVEEGSDSVNTNSCSYYANDGSTVFARDGDMVLKVDNVCNDGKCLKAGRVSSHDSFRYGIFVIEATVPKCSELWPAIWLFPQWDRQVYGGWPCSGEIDVLETTGGMPYGTFNLVAGIGEEDGEVTCNQCAKYNRQSTIEYWAESRYFVEDTKCSGGAHGAWAPHKFVLHWEEEKLSTYVDPELLYDASGAVVGLKPSVHWSNTGVPSYKVYERRHTDQWRAVRKYMKKCYPDQASLSAPFDINYQLIFNLAVGGYGGASCFWGSTMCNSTCGGAVGAEMKIHDIRVYQRLSLSTDATTPVFV